VNIEKKKSELGGGGGVSKRKREEWKLRKTPRHPWLWSIENGKKGGTKKVLRDSCTNRRLSERSQALKGRVITKKSGGKHTFADPSLQEKEERKEWKNNKKKL